MGFVAVVAPASPSGDGLFSDRAGQIAGGPAVNRFRLSTRYDPRPGRAGLVARQRRCYRHSQDQPPRAFERESCRIGVSLEFSAARPVGPPVPASFRPASLGNALSGFADDTDLFPFLICEICEIRAQNLPARFASPGLARTCLKR